MMLTDFIKRLNELKPDREKMIEEGYFDEDIEEIYNKKYTLVRKKNTTPQKTLIEDFVHNYELTRVFRIKNINFSNDLENRIIEGHIIIAGIEGGYICYESSSNKFYTCYAEDIEGTMELLCKNETDFFEILLIVAEHSTKIHEGLITIDYSSDDSKEAAIEPYIEKCEAIYPYGYYDPLFD